MVHKSVNKLRLSLAKLSRNWGWGTDCRTVKTDEIDELMKIDTFDENSTLWWNLFMLMIIQHSDENSSLWWTFISLIKIHHFDENPLLNKIHHFDINTSLWWKFITLIRINPFDNDSSFWFMFRTMIKKAVTLVDQQFDAISAL